MDSTSCKSGKLSFWFVLPVRIFCQKSNLSIQTANKAIQNNFCEFSLNKLNRSPFLLIFKSHEGIPNIFPKMHKTGKSNLPCSSCLFSQHNGSHEQIVYRQCKFSSSYLQLCPYSSSNSHQVWVTSKDVELLASRCLWRSTGMQSCWVCCWWLLRVSFEGTGGLAASAIL